MGLLLRAVYVSELNIPSKHLLPEIRIIHQTAQARNEHTGVSGILLFSDRFFVQALEGPRLNVTSTLGRILVDDRHEKVRLAQAIEVSERLFGAWTMRLVENRSEWTLRSSDRAFDPSEATADDLLLLLQRATQRSGRST